VVPSLLWRAAVLKPFARSQAAALRPTDQTFTLLGALPGDSVGRRPGQRFEPGLLGIHVCERGGYDHGRVCNLSGAAVDPINAAFGATIGAGISSSAAVREPGRAHPNLGLLQTESQTIPKCWLL